MKLLFTLILFFIFLSLHAPECEVIPAWHYVSFDIQDGRIITPNGIYLYGKLPDAFLVYERKRKFGYEILLKKFESIYYKNQKYEKNLFMGN